MTFEYPNERKQRRHGPSGYVSYESYRPWLRDEFDFRCVYCLKREAWGQVTGEFELDHFEPQLLNPQRRHDYFNLVYACRRCNSVKGKQPVDDPFVLLTSPNLTTLPDGSLRCWNPRARRLVLQLDLNSPRLKSWRTMWLRVVVLARQHDRELYSQIAGFSDDLPNLRRMRPPGNSRRQGIRECWFAKRESGQLPEVY